MKLCHKCGRLLDESNFYKHKTRGYQTQCKDCQRKGGQSYYERNKTHTKERHARNYKANQEVYYAKHREWILNNPDKAAEYRARSCSKRRNFGCEPLNEPFEGCHFHHLHIDDDHGIGIYMPAELHNIIFHNSISWQGMDEINIIALLYLSQERLHGFNQQSN